MKTYKLAANSIDGVFEVSSIPPAPTVIMSDFIDYLKDAGEDTIYGIVDESELEQIEKEYGIDRI